VEARREDEKVAEKHYWDTLRHAKVLKASGTATDEAVNAAARKVNLAARAWNKAARKRVRYQNRLELHPVLRQVWLPGFHINIGGGESDTLKDEGDLENMSNIAFAWMLDQIKCHVSVNERIFTEEQSERERHIEELNTKIRMANVKVESTRPKSWVKWPCVIAKSTLATVQRLIHKVVEEKIREIGWGTGILSDSFTVVYWANGQRRRTPGEYARDKGDYLGDTCEYIHPVVNHRVEWFKEKNAKDPSHPIYKPVHPKLKYERRKVVGEDGKVFFEYDIGGCRTPLPEWQIGGLDSYERLAIAGKSAYDYVDKLDEELGTGIRTIRRSVSPKKPPVESALATVSDFDLKTTAEDSPRPSAFGSTADETVTGTYCLDAESKL
jgi:hypothetical protein